MFTKSEGQAHRTTSSSKQRDNTLQRKWVWAQLKRVSNKGGEGLPLSEETYLFHSSVAPYLFHSSVAPGQRDCCTSERMTSASTIRAASPAGANSSSDKLAIRLRRLRVSCAKGKLTKR